MIIQVISFTFLMYWQNAWAGGGKGDAIYVAVKMQQIFQIASQLFIFLFYCSRDLLL